MSSDVFRCVQIFRCSDVFSPIPHQGTNMSGWNNQLILEKANLLFYKYDFRLRGDSIFTSPTLLFLTEWKCLCCCCCCCCCGCELALENDEGSMTRSQYCLEVPSLQEMYLLIWLSRKARGEAPCDIVWRWNSFKLNRSFNLSCNKINISMLVLMKP